MGHFYLFKNDQIVVRTPQVRIGQAACTRRPTLPDPRAESGAGAALGMPCLIFLFRTHCPKVLQFLRNFGRLVLLAAVLRPIFANKY